MMSHRSIKQFSSPNYDERAVGRSIEFLIIHYTQCNLSQALKVLTDPSGSNRVSSHYVIDEEGQIYQLVAEEKRAWHAGRPSYWAGHSDLNHSSIGIELVNPGHGANYRSFPAPQMDALISLSQEILKRYPIPSTHVLGHSDIAPQRKLDPGELFDWERLAKQGIGIDPQLITKGSCDLDEREAIKQLHAIGYEILPNQTPEQFSNVLRAFQMHFYQSGVSGTLCAETCYRIHNLYRLIHSSL